MTSDASADLRDLFSTLDSIEAVLNVEALRREAGELEQQVGSEGLWDDPDVAQRITSRLAYVQGELRRLENLRRRLDDLSVLYELAAAEHDAATGQEADLELANIRKTLGELEVRTLLSGKYDAREAVVTINAEAGGQDAADWADMLLRMYLRWAERHRFAAEIYETSFAEGGKGIKSATFTIKAPYAYGTLASEHGTHRLVRISPFDNQNRRQTSFAGVDIVPVVEQSDDIEIDESEIRIDVYRASGPGGQGVNTTDSAVRIKHLPTGIVVQCQNERSQLQNRATAMAVLRAKLLERRRQEEKAQLDALRGTSSGSWGNQIRSYVLHPYQLVKDLRTNVETSAVEATLDGQIDEFVEAGIRWRRTQELADTAPGS